MFQKHGWKDLGYLSDNTDGKIPEYISESMDGRIS
jgi:hypothetical protein